MKYLKYIFLFLVFQYIGAQNTNTEKDLKQAIYLYDNDLYDAAYNQLKHIEDKQITSSDKYQYYLSLSFLKSKDDNSYSMINQFPKNFPSSVMINGYFMQIADYMFLKAQISQSLKWYKKIDFNGLEKSEKPLFLYRIGYGFIKAKKYNKAVVYFKRLQKYSKYKNESKYFLGYMSYLNKDYDTAIDYLSELKNNRKYSKTVNYYLLDIYFVQKEYKKCILIGREQLGKTSIKESSYIAKIVGDSYFKLEKYREAINYLKQYKGKNNDGNLTSTDLYVLGYSYYKNKNFTKAISIFNKIINVDNELAQNSYYHLAECYLKNEEKNKALNAFKHALEFDFNKEIQKDAWFQYAKLSYQIGNPYQNVGDVLRKYISEYPNYKEASLIKSFIIESYIYSKDYQQAIEYIENDENISKNIIYQKALFLRANQLFEQREYESSISTYIKSENLNYDQNIKLKSIYWKSEAYYILQDYDKAADGFSKFSNSNSHLLEEYKMVYYQLGYCYFKLKYYKKAIRNFNLFINIESADKNIVDDAYMRLADCYFVDKNYWKSMEVYNQAINMGNPNSDYALFRKALAYGFVNRNDQKIEALYDFGKVHNKSVYQAEVLYVLANTLNLTNKTSKAINTYDTLINDFPKSKFTSLSMQKKGLIYYNSNNNQKAIETYKLIVDKYPNSEVAKQAVANAKRVYIDIGEVEKYAKWTKTLKNINVSDMELDNSMFEAGEIKYIDSDFDKSIVNFNKYLNYFPKGNNLLKANFYIAQSYINTNDRISSVKHYKYVINQYFSEFTENSLVELSYIYIENENWEELIPVLKQLESESKKGQNIIFAKSNLLKAYYNKGDLVKSIEAAEQLLIDENINKDIVLEVKLIIARASFETKDNEKSRIAYKYLVDNKKYGETKAEALYYLAYFEYTKANYDKSNELIQELTKDFSNFKYWGAKSLVVMANNYHLSGDDFQANYILENIIKGYKKYQDVHDDAVKLLDQIKVNDNEEL